LRAFLLLFLTWEAYALRMAGASINYYFESPGGVAEDFSSRINGSGKSASTRKCKT